MLSYLAAALCIERATVGFWWAVPLSDAATRRRGVRGVDGHF